MFLTQLRFHTGREYESNEVIFLFDRLFRIFLAKVIASVEHLCNLELSLTDLSQIILDSQY